MCDSKLVDFELLDIINLLGFKYDKKFASKGEINIQCPFCDDTKKHLNANLVRQRWRCPRCGENGNALTLYAKIMHLSNKEAYRKLVSGEVILPTKSEAIEIRRKIEPVVYDYKKINAAFSRLLQLCELNEKHKNNLLSRGLTEETIVKNQYKSVPTYKKNIEICNTLLEEKYDLIGVPGFYFDKKENRILMHTPTEGFFIPVKGLEGNIRGLQIRNDDITERKYQWFSSNFCNQGTKASGETHIIPNFETIKKKKIVCLTEGPLKADIAYQFSKIPFIALTGVNNLKSLKSILITLKKECGLKRIYGCIDMDKFTNENVKKGEYKIQNIANSIGIEFVQKNWDTKYKGIDDYLLSMHQNHQI